MCLLHLNNLQRYHCTILSSILSWHVWINLEKVFCDQSDFKMASGHSWLAHDILPHCPTKEILLEYTGLLVCSRRHIGLYLFHWTKCTVVFTWTFVLPFCNLQCCWWTKPSTAKGLLFCVDFQIYPILVNNVGKQIFTEYVVQFDPEYVSWHSTSFWTHIFQY